MKLLGKARKICLLNLTLYIDMVPYAALGTLQLGAFRFLNPVDSSVSIIEDLA